MVSFEVADPPPSSESAIQTDAPQLLPLLEQAPGIRIYTQSNTHFFKLAKVLASHKDDVPLAVIRVTSDAEVAATIKHCEAIGAPIGVRSGGNDFGDRIHVHDAVVIDVRLLNSIVLAPDRQSAKIGGGVIQGQLLQLLDREGLDTPAGWCWQVGYISWACTGGYGAENGTRGLGVDQILGARVITSGGRTVLASPSDDEDAWWCLRGGGPGLFGVVVELTIKIYPRPNLLAGSVVFPISEMAKVFGAFETLFAKDFSDKAAGETFLLNPPGTGGIICHFFWWQLEDDKSDLDEATALLKEIECCGTVLKSDVKQTTPFDFLFSVENPIMDERQYFANSSCTVSGYTRQLGDIIARHPLLSPMSCVVLHSCHGAGADMHATGSFANRTEHLLVGFSASCAYADSEMRQKLDPWPQKVLDDLQKAGLPLAGKYANFNPREVSDGKMYYGANLERVRATKARLDPENTFAIATPDFGD